MCAFAAEEGQERDLRGQLAPSGVLDGVWSSGQQPNSVLSQLFSAMGVDAAAAVPVGEDDLVTTRGGLYKAAFVRPKM